MTAEHSGSRIDLQPTGYLGSDVPIFDYSVLICDGFASLLAGQGKRIRRQELAPIAIRAGRVLLQASGGSGKTSLLLTIAAEVTSSLDPVADVSVLTAQSWMLRLGSSHADIPSAGVALLHSLQELENSSIGDVPSLVLIDGLNEIPDTLGNLLLEAVASLTWRIPGLAIIVADRITIRPVSRRDWIFATLTPVSTKTIARVLGAEPSPNQVPVLERPFYLQLARQAGSDKDTAGDIQRSALTKAGLNGSDIDCLASAVFAQYEKSQGRAFALEELRRALGTALVERLFKSGLMVQDGPYGSMAHHLLSDYLAALAVRGDSQSRSHSAFDALTFNGASFDALTILLELLSAPARDEYLRKVHDWNFYASVHLLVESKTAGLDVTPAVELVLLFMLAEKRFERITASVTHATAILQAYPDELANRLFAVKTWEEIVTIVASQHFETDWFATWKRLILRRPGSPATDEDLSQVSSAEGIIGWSAANLMRRLSLSRAMHQKVVALAVSSDPMVRWRGVHILGARHNRAAEEQLLHCLQSDEYMWARYGALRSLIEAAASVSQTRRRRIFSQLSNIAEMLTESTILAGEIARDLEIQNPPDDWADSAGQLVERLLEIATSVSDQDRWRRVGARLRLGADVVDSV